MSLLQRQSEIGSNLRFNSTKTCEDGFIQKTRWFCWASMLLTITIYSYFTHMVMILSEISVKQLSGKVNSKYCGKVKRYKVQTNRESLTQSPWNNNLAPVANQSERFVSKLYTNRRLNAIRSWVTFLANLSFWWNIKIWVHTHILHQFWEL